MNFGSIKTPKIKNFNALQSLTVRAINNNNIVSEK